MLSWHKKIPINKHDSILQIVIVNIYRKKFGIWLQTYLHESFIFNNIYILILEKPFGLFKSFQ